MRQKALVRAAAVIAAAFLILLALSAALAHKHCDLCGFPMAEWVGFEPTVP